MIMNSGRRYLQLVWLHFLVIPGTLLGTFSAARGAEPIPPLMKTLLEIFPEQNGWFVESALGAVPGIPDEARAFFECPRVLVPGFHQIDLAAGKVLAAGMKLPVKKITRYDRKPGAAGLPGFRGVWCSTEEKSDAGFLLLTPNQNRYLIWARHCYYPAFAVDSIPSKIRDWYARSVADHLASVDYGVPAAVPPQAAERNLPVWMDLYPDTASGLVEQTGRFDSLLAAAAEMKIWGCSGFTEIVPTPATIDRFIATAVETLFENLNLSALQDEYRDFLAINGGPFPVNALTSNGFDTLPPGWYIFAVDRFGRVRIAATSGPAGSRSPGNHSAKHPSLSNHALLFPDQPLLAAGRFEVVLRDGHRAIQTVTAWSDHFFYCPLSVALPQDITDHSDDNLLSLGHLFASLKQMGVPPADLRIRKF
jgi:hypothetical protein